MLETDPVDIALDVNGDIEIDPSTGLRMASGLEGVEQLCRVATSTFMGEVFTDLKEGLDWYGLILGKPFRENVIRAEFRRVLLTVPNVTEVVAVLPTFNRATRVMEVKWQTRTVWGDSSVDTLTQVV